MKKLTTRQKDILQRLKKGEELVYAVGGGWWVGLEQVGGKTVNALIVGCALHLDYKERDDSFLIYSINETGKEALRSGEIMTYTDVLNLVNRHNSK